MPYRNSSHPSDGDGQPPGPEAHIGAYNTTDDQTVIYDTHASEAWISSTVAVLLSDLE